MLAAARDVYAVFYLEKQLGRLREEYLTAALAGSPPPAEFWKAGQDRIWNELREKFYSRQMRQVVRAAEADTVSDADDFAARTQTQMEVAVLNIHRTLSEIPFLGQLEYCET